jgi:hypothetical protein
MTTSGDPSRDASIPPSDAGAGENALDPQRHEANVGHRKAKGAPNRRFADIKRDHYYGGPSLGAEASPVAIGRPLNV